jgi:hypothetical protein
VDLDRIKILSYRKLGAARLVTGTGTLYDWPSLERNSMTFKVECVAVVAEKKPRDCSPDPARCPLELKFIEKNTRYIYVYSNNDPDPALVIYHTKLT